MPWAAIIPLVTSAVSLASSASASRKRKKSEQALEAMQTPTYAPNKSILDYYDKALQKYNTSPTDSAEYKMQKQNIKQNTVQGLSSLNKLRSNDVSNLIQGESNSLLKAAVAGEQRKAQEFNVLGQATRMKAGEDKDAFQQNFVAPFEKNYNLLAMKAAGQAQVQNQSMQNAYTNANSAATILGGMDTDMMQQAKFGSRFKEQGGSAYNWSQANRMNFGKYKKLGNQVGGSLYNWY